MKEYQVGIIGWGVVGRGIERLLSDLVVEIYDPYMTPALPSITSNPKKRFKKLDLAIICVPTPTCDDGKTCDTSAVEDTLVWLNDSAFKGVVLLKSTTPPSEVLRLKEKYGVRLVFSPEFLGESKYYTPFWKYPDPSDMRTHMWQVFGGEREDTSLCIEIFKRKMSVDTQFFQTDIVTASLAKYIENSFFALKVTFVNEWYDIAKTYGADWNELRELWLADPRVNRNHTLVFEKDRGYGGKCLVPNTRITTTDGYKYNQDLVVGDEILTDEGVTTITQVGCRTVSETHKIYAKGRLIEGSGDHLQIVNNNGFEEKKELKDIVVGDFVFIPYHEIPEKVITIQIPNRFNNKQAKIWHNEITLTPDICYVVGLILADGCISDYKYRTLITLGESKRDLIPFVVSVLKTMGLNPYVYYSESMGTYGLSRVWNIRISSKWFQSFLLELGIDKDKNKVKLLPNSLSVGLIGGWLDGDGSITDSNLSGYSRKKELIYCLDRMFLSNGVLVSIGKEGEELRIMMKDDIKKVLNWCRRLRLDFTWIRENSNHSPNTKSIAGGWLVRVKKTELIEENSDVISIETDNGKYIANNILTHNCFPKDVKAIIADATSCGYIPQLMESVDATNDVFRKLNKEETT